VEIIELPEELLAALPIAAIRELAIDAYLKHVEFLDAGQVSLLTDLPTRESADARLWRCGYRAFVCDHDEHPWGSGQPGDACPYDGCPGRLRPIRPPAG
jgi:hypothetical protein